MEEFDLVVIGGGPAGEKAAAKASYFGKKVALVEKAREPGGAGVHTGTLPSKTLKETALFLSGRNDRGIFGIDRNLKREVSIQDFYFRKNFVTNSEVNAINANLDVHKIKVFHGTADLLNQNEVKIVSSNDTIIKGEYILIATGSVPFHPENIPFENNKVHDSDSILSLKRFPKSLCVLGGGVIGCEYVTIFGTMGIPVTLIDTRDEILPFLDSEISRALVEEMKREGITVLLNEGVKKVEKISDHDELKIELNSGEIIYSDMFLFAAGRNGNVSGLGLEKLGIQLTKRGTIEVNEKYQTIVSNIFAVGDVIGFPALASTSMDQGRAAVTHMFNTEGIDKLTHLFPYGIYTVPEVSMVGLSSEEAIKKGIDIAIGKARYIDLPRGKILGQDSGFLKIVANKKTYEVLGIHIIGYLATELIHYGMAVLENKKNLNDLISVVFNYPTLHDLYKYAAFDCLGDALGHKVRK
ncbi:MAG: Si-specific NAD(P)(+) transhydrogenase [Leptospiraceae bacterium]|nr:Si-specific NAD(P)(+) transhydrogenase [Leptospiraceae bacterium]